MLKFLSDSKTFGGIYFQGNYDMPICVLQKLYDIYLVTGINYIDSYTDVIHLVSHRQKYISDKGWMFDCEKAERYQTSISTMRKYKLFDSDTLSECRSLVKELYIRHKNHIEYQRGQQRRDASNFISNKKIRDAVFAKYGKQCLCCGSTKKITIDHVVPVYHGGENNLDNLQPLCKSCNSRKNTSNKDYRHG